MIKLELAPYCQRCGGFEAETRHLVLYGGEDLYEDSTTIVCKNACKCAVLYEYIQRGAPNLQSVKEP